MESGTYRYGGNSDLWHASTTTHYALLLQLSYLTEEGDALKHQASLLKKRAGRTDFLAPCRNNAPLLHEKRAVAAPTHWHALYRAY